jgi:hypothetical protein
VYPIVLWLSIIGLIKIRKNKEKLKENNLFGVSIHALIFVTVNVCLIVGNLFSYGGFPWSWFIFSTWAVLLTIHVIRRRFTERKFNSVFHFHCLFAVVSWFNIFAIWRYMVCRFSGPVFCEAFSQGSLPLLGMLGFILLWSVLLTIHFLIHKKRNQTQPVLPQWGPQFNPQYHPESEPIVSTQNYQIQSNDKDKSDVPVQQPTITMYPQIL